MHACARDSGSTYSYITYSSPFLNPDMEEINLFGCRAGNNAYDKFIIPISSYKTFKYKIYSYKLGIANMYALAYRRIGSNY